MSKSATLSLFAITLILAACSPEPEVTKRQFEPVTREPESAPVKRASLPEVFDCLRENKGSAIAAHRGGPYPGYPENAIETMQYNFDRGVRVFEIDIAESQDGVLFLMHDRSLTRTTTGDGFLAEWDWADLQTLKLRDNNGEVTGFDIPTLADALEWAVETGAIVELDKKPTTSFANIIAAVEAANAEDNVIMISYNDDQAFEIARINPDLMMTASAFGDRDIRKLVNGGVNQDSLIAWTGTNEPDFAAWDRVLAEGVEAAFGTLGRPGERLDDKYLADGNGSEFQALVDAGLTLIATDAPLEVAEAINGDDIASEVCGL